MIAFSYVLARKRCEGDVRSRTPIVRFAEGGGFSGNTGCNNFFGTLRIEGSTISMGPIGSTMMMCPEPLMEQERAVLGALETARGVSIDADDLVLTDADGTPVLTATRAAP